MADNDSTKRNNDPRIQTRSSLLSTIKKADQGAERYICSDIKPFDEKNMMFRRPLWDPELREIAEEFYVKPVMPKEKPGYGLHDLSLVNASWRLEREFGKGNRGGRMGFYDWEWDGQFVFPKVPPGLKTPEKDPAVLSRWVKKTALLFGAAKVGLCELDRRWLYSSVMMVNPDGYEEMENNVPEEYTHVIAIAVEMDYEATRCSPAGPASMAVGSGYSKMTFTAGLLAQFIRGLGYKAVPTGNDTAVSIPIAIDAGLGELARNGLLITPEFGPRVRLAKVLTNMPLVPDQPIEFGVWQFCKTCKKCAKKCPSNSIPMGDPDPAPHNISNREGVMAWHVNAETCIAFWARNGTDCSNCIKVCPFNKLPGKWHDLVRWGISNTPWLNPMFLWGDDLMGYGKTKNPKLFWD